MTGALSAQHRASVLTAAELARGSRTPADLAGLLYARWYAPPAAHAARPAHLPPRAGVYRAVHAGARRPWAPARVVDHGVAGVVVVRTADGELRAMTRGEYVHVGAGADDVLVSPIRGAVVSGGWWRTWGGGWDVRRPPVEVSRVYLAAADGDATALVAAVTACLAAAPHPWLFKVGVDEMTLARPDAGVVYLPDQALPTLLRVLAGVTDGLRRPAVPALTCAAAPGLAWAHSPAGDRSFGETVCAVLAQALGDDPDDAVAAAERAFVDAGIDPSRPHLRPAVRERVGA